MNLINQIAKAKILEFTKTNDAESTKAPKFSVTLGVIPDYMYEGTGMKMDGVTEGKPASKAGMKSGDVLIMLGEHEIRDMRRYMEVLAKFHKGDTVKAKIKRGTEELELTVQF